MITPEMFEIFDGHEGQRRMHYGMLLNNRLKMQDLLMFLVSAQANDGYLDFGVGNEKREFWIGLTRPGMPADAPNAPRRDLYLIEFLIEWASGVERHAYGEIFQMDERYGGLRKLPLARMIPADLIYRPEGRRNWLKRLYKSIF
jgi:hypothetical protein